MPFYMWCFVVAGVAGTLGLLSLGLNAYLDRRSAVEWGTD